jgi:cytochrome c-type biogenesis protein CcmH/NrfG
MSKRLFVPVEPARGLPPRIYLPIFVTFAVVFLGTIGYLLAVGFGVTGSLFGKAAAPVSNAQRQSENTNVQGGPPAAVVAQLQALRARVARDPKDDVALTQLGDLYLAAGKAADAIPYYRRALKANPGNVAARAGLDQATHANVP